MGLVRQCKLRRGAWYTVAWVPDDEAEVGRVVEIVMLRTAGTTVEGQPLLRHFRERWRVVETWGALPDPHRSGEAAEAENSRHD